MLKPFSYRIHEWLADHFSWVQYPGITDAVKSPFFKNAMPASTRIGLATFGIIVLSITLIFMIFMLAVIWFII